MNKYKEKMEEMVSDCIECGLCTRNCLFLDKYNINLREFSTREDIAYHCFLCGECKRVCPKNIDGRQIAIEMRRKLVEDNSGKIPEKGYSMLVMEKKDYIFKNYRKAKGNTVLFPGCNFPSFYPKATDKIEKLLESYGIGVVYDCCGKPILELGMKTESDKIIENINYNLDRIGIRRIVTMCPNCYYFLKDRINAEVISIYSLLSELGIGKNIAMENKSLFIPCPDRDNREIIDSFSCFINDTNKIKSIKSQCCGLGGCAGGKESDISKKFADEAIKNSEEEMLVYCASCAGNFSRNGHNNVKHILNEILEIEENPEKSMKSIFNRMKKKF